MNQFIVFIVLLCASGIIASSEESASSKSSEEVTAFGLNSLEGLRKKIRTGIPKYQIPQLEPYYIDSYEYTLANDFGRFEIQTTSTKFKGFESFVIKEAQLEQTFDKTKFKYEFAIEVPQVTVSGNYKIHGLDESTKEITGDGLFEAIIDFIKISGDGKIQYVEGEGWSVPSIDCEVSIKTLDGTLHNFNGKDLVNKRFVNKRELRHLNSKLETRVCNVFTEYTKILLNDYTPKTLEDKISSGANFFGTDLF